MLDQQIFYDILKIIYKREVCQIKRILFCCILIILIITLSSCSSQVVKGSIIRQSNEGAAVLDIMPQKLFEIAAIGDTVTVTIGDFEKELILTDDVITEDGKYQLIYNSNEHSISIYIYGKNFCDVHTISNGANVKIEKK